MQNELSSSLTRQNWNARVSDNWTRFTRVFGSKDRHVESFAAPHGMDLTSWNIYHCQNRPLSSQWSILHTWYCGRCPTILSPNQCLPHSAGLRISASKAPLSHISHQCFPVKMVPPTTQNLSPFVCSPKTQFVEEFLNPSHRDFLPVEQILFPQPFINVHHENSSKSCSMGCVNRLHVLWMGRRSSRRCN